jgi:hypothetical protein
MATFIVTYSDKQYDVRSFLRSHPAGEDIILPFKDKDITEEFEAVGHSKGALRILHKYLLVCKPDIDKPDIDKPNNDKPDNDKPDNDNIITKKLFTSEDRYNIHKGLGAFALFSFAYRYFYIFPKYGNLGFDGTTFDILTLFSHFALSSSSLLFHVLDKRIVERPLIIYEEYRLHAILFTTTAVSVSLFGMYATKFMDNSFQKIVLVAMIFALRGLVDSVTSNYGTKGVTAVRNNNDGEYKYVRLFYSFYQICALGSFITYNDDLRDLGFNTLIAIQSSTFLMTLKRKSLIRWKSHVLWYSFALLLSYWVMYRMREPTFFFQMLAVFFIRVQFNINKYLLWSAYVVAYYTQQMLLENSIKLQNEIMY